jgi:uncharacterized protein
MIRVQIERNQLKREQINSFTLSGHADSGPYGHDLVCAAVSAVSIGSINAIEVLCGVEPKIETRDNGGFLKMILPSNIDEHTFERIQLIIQTMIVSLETIERDYGQYITISDK